jgi:hypothetical protein
LCIVAPMGVMYEYFAAPSDEAAAAMIDAVGGPGGPPPPSPALEEARRTGDVEALRKALHELSKPKVRESASGTLVLECKGIDPMVKMGTLEELLTGTSYDEITGRPRYGKELAADDWGSPSVLTVADELQTALTDATDDQLMAVAVPWSQTEEFDGDGDPDILTAFLRELAVLARTAGERGERLYCWVSL